MTLQERLNNKKIFLNIFNTYVNREGKDKLIEYLEKSDFFSAPASSKYHLNEEGGLCKHSLNVFQLLRTENIPEISMESIVIVSLLHDLCKVNFYKLKQGYNNTSYYTIEEKLPYGHGEKSVFLIERYMKLTVNEALAIRFHMGIDKNDMGVSAKAFNICPLAVYLSMADFESTFVMENSEFIKNHSNGIFISNSIRYETNEKEDIPNNTEEEFLGEEDIDEYDCEESEDNKV